MMPMAKKISLQTIYFTMISGIFFTFFYIYIWLFIEPRLIYHSFGIFVEFPAFSISWSFFKESVSHPGGPIKYLSAFLSQLYYYSWLGGLIVTITTGLICLCLSRLGNLGGFNLFTIICYIPAFIILLIYNKYGHPLMLCLLVLAGVVFAIIYEVLSSRYTRNGFYLFIFMSAVLYYIAGSGSLIFVFSAAVYEIFIRRKPLRGLLYLPAGAGVCLVTGYGLFGLDISETFMRSLPFQQKLLMQKFDMETRFLSIALFIAVPLVILFGSICQNITVSRKFPENRSVSNVGFVIRQLVDIIILLAVTFLCSYASLDRTKKNFQEIIHLTHQKRWGKVLETARNKEAPKFNKHVNHCIDLALYKTGRFEGELLFWPQSPSSLLLRRIKNRTALEHLLGIDIFLELGHINLSERNAYQAMEVIGKHTRILKQLVTINLIKGQEKTARAYLKVLSKDLIHRRYGKQMLYDLDSDLVTSMDERISLARSLMPEQDMVSATGEEEVLLQALLSKDSSNPMAVEYLLAYYLLDKRLDKFIQHLDYLKEPALSRLPKLYEEAILLHQFRTKKEVKPYGQRVSRSSQQRFEDMLNVMEPCPDAEARKKELRKYYPSSYVLYYMSKKWK